MWTSFLWAALGLFIATVLGWFLGFWMSSNKSGKFEEELAAANDELKSSKSLLKKSESQVKDKENQINTLLGKSSKLNDEIGALKAQIADTEKSNRSLKADVSSKDIELKRLRETEAKFDEMLPKFENNTQIAKELSVELDAIKNNGSEWETKFNSLVKDNESFKLDYDDMVNKSLGLKNDLDGANAEIAKLKREAEKVAANASGNLDKAKADLSAAESAKAAAQAETSSVKSQVTDLNSKIGGLEGEIASLKAKLEAAENDTTADDFKAKWEELQIGNGKLLQEVELLKAKLTNATNASADTSELDTLKAKLASANADCEDCNSKQDALNAKIAELEAALAASQAKEEEEEEEISDEIFAEVYEVEEMPSEAEVVAAVGRVAEKAENLDRTRIGNKADDSSDDLKRIKGIGEFTEKKLHAAGINSFLQISKFDESDEDNVEEVIEFFPGRVRRYDWVGQAKEILGIELTKEEEQLSRMKRKAGAIDFDKIGYASAKDKDDLKEIKGIGPFIEKKLNAIGIFKFRQVSKFDGKIDDIVNKAIEFFPGRIKRDDWKGQAKVLADAKENA